MAPFVFNPLARPEEAGWRGSRLVDEVVEEKEEKDLAKIKGFLGKPAIPVSVQVNGKVSLKATKVMFAREAAGAGVGMGTSQAAGLLGTGEEQGGEGSVEQNRVSQVALVRRALGVERLSSEMRIAFADRRLTDSAIMGPF